MRRSRKHSVIITMLMCFVMSLLMAGSSLAEELTAPAPESDKEVVIIYTNDIHTYVNNYLEDEEGNKVRGLSYANVAAMKKDIEAEGKSVILVDAGDHVQGTAYGGMDEGEHMIQLMNACEYAVSTPGNHEFDYGTFNLFKLMDHAEFEYISCNFCSVESGRNVLAPSVIYECDGVKIGFIGISTPTTLTSSTPAYFQDENGNYIYDFLGSSDGKKLYDAVQAEIDRISPKVDYTIAIGHLGVDVSSAPYRSTDVIANTSGLDAFIDGHSHTVMEGMDVTDKDGKPVLLTQTGCYYNSIGKMVISPEGITTELIREYDKADETVNAMQQEWIDDIDGMLNQRIAVNEIEFTDKDVETGLRLVRRGEINLGDLNADAYYYYFNEIEKMPCDIVLQNGGGIRTSLPAGDISYASVKAVNPFGNVICMINTKGQVIIDALEMGSSQVGIYNEEAGAFAESGGFLQVAGLKYDIDTSISSTIEVDQNGMWVSGPSGEYRVKNVQVYNRETGTYEDIDPERMYRVGGLNYILRNSGSGLSMFAESELIIDYVGEDYMLFSEYLMSFEKDEEGIPHISTDRCPLINYPGYLLNYDNPYGSGRITIK